jgi:hypothetical protein
MIDTMRMQPRVTLVLFTALLTVFQTVLADDENQRHWDSIRERVVQPERNTNATLLDAQIIQRLQTTPSFADLMRQKLRSDPNPDVRCVVVTFLSRALKDGSKDDCLFALSDPNPGVRLAALHPISHYEWADMAPYVGALLLSREHVERWASLWAIRRLLNGNGLPYYAMLLNDADVDIASEAAKAIGCVCAKNDATPRLLHYLKEQQGNRSRQEVLKQVVYSLCALYGEPALPGIKPQQEARKWIQRLENEGSTIKRTMP